MLVAIEGIDGSGKGTQARKLHERIRKTGAKSALISFPRYDATLFGRAIGDFLNGRFGTLNEVNPFLVSLLYAGDRFESRAMLSESLEQNDVVILDRFVASNIAHQGAKVDGAERDELVAWIRKIEFEIYNLPRPDLTFLLDLPAAAAQELIRKKEARSYTDKPADLQEADADYLERVRLVYRELAEREPNWHQIDVLKGETIRTVDDVGNDIWSVLDALSPA